jgi:O-antigen ligase
MKKCYLSLTRIKMLHPIERHTGTRQGKIILWGIMIPILIMDWNYSRPSFTLPLILSYSGLIAGLLLPFFFLITPHITLSSYARATFKRLRLIGFGLILVLLIQGLVSPEAWATYNQFYLIDFICLLLWFLTGYFYASNPDATKKLLSRFATFAAYGSLYSFCLRLAGLSASVPFGVASWPMRLFFLFGFCWYLCLFLFCSISGEKSFRGILFGLIACSLEVLVTLHKPIIWAAFFCIATLFLIFRVYLPRRQFRKAISKGLKYSVALVLVLLVMNGIFHGVVTKEINTFITERVLHQSAEESAITLDRVTAGRFELWSTALKDFYKSPWFGIGINDVENQGGRVSLHNGYLDLLSIFGIFGFALFLYSFGFWLKRMLKSLNYITLLFVQTSCLIFIVGILMFNMGGTSRIFPGITNFIALISGISLRLAVFSSPNNLADYIPSDPISE